MGLKQKKRTQKLQIFVSLLKILWVRLSYMFKNRDERKNNNVCINLSGEDFPSTGAYLTGVYASL
jgi:hypothetical protein